MATDDGTWTGVGCAAGLDAYSGWEVGRVPVGGWFPGASRTGVEVARQAVRRLEEVAAGLAVLDLGDWQGAAAQAARDRLSTIAPGVASVTDRAHQGLAAMVAQEQAVEDAREALAAAAGAA